MPYNFDGWIDADRVVAVGWTCEDELFLVKFIELLKFDVLLSFYRETVYIFLRKCEEEYILVVLVSFLF